MSDQRDASKWVISIFKNHFIAGLDSVNSDIALHLWCRIIPHAVIMLNLLRKSRINPKLSGHAILHGEFNYNATLLAPPGTKVVV